VRTPPEFLTSRVKKHSGNYFGQLNLGICPVDVITLRTAPGAPSPIHMCVVSHRLSRCLLERPVGFTEKELRQCAMPFSGRFGSKPGIYISLGLGLRARVRVYC